jgi:hypothetical protein
MWEFVGSCIAINCDFELIYMKVFYAGITILVVLYGYVLLAPQAWIAVMFFLGVSCLFHVLFYLQVLTIL